MARWRRGNGDLREARGTRFEAGYFERMIEDDEDEDWWLRRLDDGDLVLVLSRGEESLVRWMNEAMVD